jgi:hypothetical protein
LLKPGGSRWGSRGGSAKSTPLRPQAQAGFQIVVQISNRQTDETAKHMPYGVTAITLPD